MKNKAEITNKKKSSPVVFSKIKNSNLVKNRQLLIAKKAAKLFIKKGYANTTIREISKATGLAMGNLYDYIKKKEDILCLVFDTYHQSVEESAFGPAIASIEDPLEQLRAYIKTALNNVHEYRDEIMLMYRESSLLPPKYLEKAKNHELMQIKQTAAILRRGMEKGIFKTQDPYFVSSMLFCLFASPALRGWTFKGKYSREKVYQLLEEFIEKNLLTK